MKAIIFEGGEFVDRTNEIEMSDWSLESIEKAFIDYNSKGWADEVIDMYTDGDQTMRDTIDVINPTMAQATKCPEDGGMIYLVQTSN